jgi:enoyl-CoA hydratase
MADLVLFEKRGEIGVITLNRPEVRNAQNTALLIQLDEAFARLADDGELRVGVLRGAGSDFSAGHDIGSAGLDYDVQYPRIATLSPGHVGLPGAELRLAYEEEWYLGLCRRWRDLPKPTIAMVQGACIAGGLMLAWICDLIVASNDAYFADPVLRMGVPGVEYFAHPWEMNPRQAKEMLFTGGRIKAGDALNRGMINRVVDRAELEQRTFELADEIAAMPRFGVTLAKKAVNQAQDAMGMRGGIDAAFGLHQLAHSHNVEISGSPLLRHTAKTMKSAAEAGTPPN